MIKPKKLNLKSLSKVVAEEEFVSNSTLSSSLIQIMPDIQWSAYTNKSGKVLVVVPELTILVFDNVHFATKHVSSLKELSKKKILAPLDYLDLTTFIAKKDIYINTLSNLSQIPIPNNMDDLKSVNGALSSFIRKYGFIKNFSSLFPLLVAAVGDIIAYELKGEWKMENNSINTELWISVEERKYNPYMKIYRLYSENYQTIDLVSVITGELLKSNIERA